MVARESTLTLTSPPAKIGLGDAYCTWLSGRVVEWIQARPKVLDQVRSAIMGDLVGRTAHEIGEAVRHELLGLYCNEIDIPELRGVDWTQVGSRFPFALNDEPQAPLWR